MNKLKTYTITVHKYFNDYFEEELEIEAPNQKEAEAIANEQIRREHDGDFDIYDVESEEQDEEDTYSRELLVAIGEQNIALERSGGDYWNYDAVEDYLEMLEGFGGIEP